jgi:glycosyltransferase involved in cell wall biosynthesis
MTVNSQAGARYALASRIRPTRLYPMPNVMDTDHFKPSSPGPLPNHTLRLLAVGRLSPQKRMDRFLSVVNRLRHASPKKIQAVLAGEGPLRPALEQQARATGLFPNIVKFLGSVSDVAPLYQQSDICVLTSDYEGLPNVLLEAMASGLPVVSTRVGGVPQIVQEGETGFMVAPDDEDAMVSAIRLLSENPDLRQAMGRQGRAFVEENHSLAHLPALLRGLYRRALGMVPSPDQSEAPRSVSRL